jgi:hypothetical protein
MMSESIQPTFRIMIYSLIKSNGWLTNNAKKECERMNHSFIDQVGAMHVQTNDSLVETSNALCNNNSTVIVVGYRWYSSTYGAGP